jgi:hypothetical protein
MASFPLLDESILFRRGRVHRCQRIPKTLSFDVVRYGPVPKPPHQTHICNVTRMALVDCCTNQPVPGTIGLTVLREPDAFRLALPADPVLPFETIFRLELTFEGQGGHVVCGMFMFRQSCPAAAVPPSQASCAYAMPAPTASELSHAAEILFAAPTSWDAPIFDGLGCTDTFPFFEMTAS